VPPNELKLNHGSGERKWQLEKAQLAGIDIECTAQWSRWRSAWLGDSVIVVRSPNENDKY